MRRLVRFHRYITWQSRTARIALQTSRADCALWRRRHQPYAVDFARSYALNADASPNVRFCVRRRPVGFHLPTRISRRRSVARFSSTSKTRLRCCARPGSTAARDPARLPRGCIVHPLAPVVADIDDFRGDQGNAIDGAPIVLVRDLARLAGGRPSSYRLAIRVRVGCSLSA